MMGLILITMESLAGLVRPWVWRLTTSDLGVLARSVGADGLEFFPIKCAATEQVLTMKPTSDLAASVIMAAHQSWRSEQNVRMLFGFFKNHWRSPKLCYLATVSYFSVVERRASMAHLVALEAARLHQDDPLPMLIYPHHTGFIGGQHRNEDPYPAFDLLVNTLVEPEPSLLQPDRWAVHTAVEFAQKAKIRGYRGFCLSRHIIPAWPITWIHVIKDLLADTKLVRIEAGDYDSQSVLYCLLRLGYNGPVVVRIKPTSPFWQANRFTRAYSLAVSQTRAMMAQWQR